MENKFIQSSLLRRMFLAAIHGCTSSNALECAKRVSSLMVSDMIVRADLRGTSHHEQFLASCHGSIDVDPQSSWILLWNSPCCRECHYSIAIVGCSPYVVGLTSADDRIRLSILVKNAKRGISPSVEELVKPLSTAFSLLFWGVRPMFCVVCVPLTFRNITAYGRAQMTLHYRLKMTVTLSRKSYMVP